MSVFNARLSGTNPPPAGIDVDQPLNRVIVSRIASSRLSLIKLAAATIRRSNSA